MADYAFPPIIPSVAIAGRSERFAVRRILCIGRNYVDHAKEMGAALPDPGALGDPIYFAKPADAVCPAEGDLPFPGDTENLHHEIEAVLAIGARARNLPVGEALGCVFGYSVGVDLTKRDRQAEAKAGGGPWERAKSFDHSAPLAPIRAASDIGHPTQGRLHLSVNGNLRQDGDIAAMIWPPAALTAFLSRMIELQPGDLIFTGTPAGVGPIRPGDVIEGGLAGVGEFRMRFTASG